MKLCEGGRQGRNHAGRRWRPRQSSRKDTSRHTPYTSSRTRVELSNPLLWKRLHGLRSPHHPAIDRGPSRIGPVATPGRPDCRTCPQRFSINGSRRWSGCTPMTCPPDPGAQASFRFPARRSAGALTARAHPQARAKSDERIDASRVDGAPHPGRTGVLRRLLIFASRAYRPPGSTGSRSPCVIEKLRQNRSRRTLQRAIHERLESRRVGVHLDGNRARPCRDPEERGGRLHHR